MSKVSDELVSALFGSHADIYVKVSGLSFIDQRVARRGIDAIIKCSTVGDAIAEAEKVSAEWVEQGFFKKADFSLEPLAGGSTRDVLIHFNVTEARPKKSVGVFTTDTALPEVRAGLTNIFGGKYSVNLSYIPPAARLHSWSLTLLSQVPWFGKTAEYSLGARTETKTLHPADAERIEELKLTTKTDGGALEFGFQRRTMASRDSHQLPSDLLRDFSTHTKGFLRHEIHVDRSARHSSPTLFHMYPLPVTGYEVNMISEVCGGLLGGLPCFHKWDCQGSKYFTLGRFFSLQWSLKLGSVAPLTDARIPVNDRLFLSQRHVRGYKSVGPCTFDTDNNMTRYAATGGNALFATSVSLNFPFLLYPSNGMVAMHAFVDCGALRWIRKAKELTDWQEWCSASKASVGVGFIITRFPLIGSIHNGRFELNFSLPLRVEQWSPLRFAKRPIDARLFDSVKFGLTWSSAVSM